MRIANNIMAQNTFRQYTINNNNVAKSAEKLSSGYRINRAGDDAAGLAISEKMRSQIRGLDMAAKNSQDAISLVQTAEGALQQVHSMLQRMNELAVQSSTGSNESFDRSAIAAEFTQLKAEITQISKETTFNNMNILDGSLGANAVSLSDDNFDGVVTKVAGVNEMVVGSTMGTAGTNNFTITASTGITASKAGAYTFETGRVDNAGAWVADNTDTATDLKINFVGEDGTTKSYQMKIDDAIKGNTYGQASATFTLDLSSAGLGKYTMQSGTAVENTRENFIEDLTGVNITTTTGNVKTTAGAATTAAGNLSLSVEGATKGSYSVTAGGAADEVVFTNTATGATSTHTVGTGAAASTVTLDLTSIGLGNFSYNMQADGADGDATTTLETVAALTGLGTFEVTGNATDTTGAMQIQVGALEGEQMELAIGKMDTEGLGIDGSDISTQADAGKAITATRAAINTVSDQRALLGAIQNRLDYKVSNLNVSSENLSAAESRIRDVDIAKEMTNYTKNNILSQAATAMLAQANSAPQNVLSLLK